MTSVLFRVYKNPATTDYQLSAEFKHPTKFASVHISRYTDSESLSETLKLLAQAIHDLGVEHADWVEQEIGL